MSARNRPQTGPLHETGRAQEQYFRRILLLVILLLYTTPQIM